MERPGSEKIFVIDEEIKESKQDHDYNMKNRLSDNSDENNNIKDSDP